ncbi:hypothetical protein GUJ93_ZPchr0007g6025 [Zizania palustris]|uniref:Uncharacterized protein n=1 Tax=Zizania palustris TaxID=103762 RepID=A0A8J5TFV7_ZIZPA|nr:hypothetical protein GUJ93_ZPchr0007g6025 [Zizania palustris]
MVRPWKISRLPAGYPTPWSGLRATATGLVVVDESLTPMSLSLPYPQLQRVARSSILPSSFHWALGFGEWIVAISSCPWQSSPSRWLVPRAGGYGYPWPLCGDAGSNFPARSKYLANINLIGTTLPSNASSSPELFATAAGVGSVPDQVSALALCRGDANASLCLTCLNQAFRDLPNACGYSKDATVFYESCQLSYSNASIFPVVVSGKIEKYMFGSYTNVTKEPARFNRVVAALVNATANYAAYNSTRRYASGEADFNQEYPKVYSWAQCTPDLTPARCRGCLTQIIADSIGLFESRIWAGTLAVRCSFRYNTLPFLNGSMQVQLLGPPARSGSPAPAPAPAPVVPTVNVTPPVATPTTSTATPAGGRKYSVPGLVLIILLPTLAAVNLVVGLCFCFWRRRRPVTKAKHTYASYPTEAEDIESLDSMFIDISTLRAATDDFAETNKLGEGGFGAVYKGVLPDGDEIAVKRLSKSSTQGVEELKNELALIAKLKHKNLVSLVGVCLEQQERLLVYEFVPNRSLDLTLFDTEKCEQLDWEKSRDQTQAVTKRVIGTFGYMAPEYQMRGNYSIKSDTFSFGVMVLEIVTGRKNNESYNSQQSEDLLTKVWEQWVAGTVLQTVDPSMNGSFSESDVLRCINVGLLCVQGNPTDRPLMSAVVLMLGSETVELQAPSKPTFFSRNGNGGAVSGVVPGVSTASMEERPSMV